jgi:hypothetical protein
MRTSIDRRRLIINLIRFTLSITTLVISGCTAEGNSYFVGRGESQRFISLATCEKEARSSHPDGTSRYYNYECRELLFDRWIMSVNRYKDGKLIEKQD